MWEIPVELKRLYPELPIFSDPSHISGNRELLASVAQKALDLDFDGLMLESHIDPDKAWSDPKQQVKPERLGEIVKGLIIREEKSEVADTQLEELRSEIDRIDNYILNILSERMDIAEKIAEFKKQNNVTILQAGRWDAIVHDRVQKGLAKGLTEDFLKDLLNAIHQESIRHQTVVMNK